MGDAAGAREQTASKLKARMDQWQTYVEQPPTSPPRTPPEPPPPRRDLARVPVEKPNGSSSYEVHPGPNARPAAPKAPEGQAPVDARLERCEALIADLQATVEYERKQTQRLAAALANVQAMPREAPTPPRETPTYPREAPAFQREAPAFQAATPRRPTPTVPPRPRPGQTYVEMDGDPDTNLYDHARRTSVLLSFCAIMLIAGVACLCAFLLVR